MNKYLTIGFVLLLIVVAYLFGKVQVLSNNKTNEANIQTPLPVTPTVSSIPVKKVIAKPSTPVPTAQSKVAVTITEVGTAGTYYCFSDKANQLAQKQSDLNNLHKIFQFCADDLRFKIGSCDYSNPSSCPSGTECDSKSKDVMNAQDDLRKMIQSYCP